MPEMPSSTPPKNIARTLEEGDGFWEDERWLPIRLTTMSGIQYNGREIPVAWQIEFESSQDEFEAANAKIQDMDFEPDGYGWGECIQKVIRKNNPALARRLHTTDCETDTCVIWVESEGDCHSLLKATWKLIYEE
jgi:hypothetical protein